MLLWQPFSKAQSSDVATMPYFYGFEDPSMVGWKLIADGNVIQPSMVHYNSNTIGICSDSPYEGSYHLCTSSWYCVANFWAISPAIVIDNERYTLSWYDKRATSDYTDQYSVMVSTSGTNVADFTETIYTTNGSNVSSDEYTMRVVDLSQFEGQTIHIAYHHFGSSSQGALYFDNFMVNDGRPVITMVKGPDFVYANDTARFSLEFLDAGEYEYMWSCEDAAMTEGEEDSIFTVLWDDGVENGFHTINVSVVLDTFTIQASKQVYVANCINNYVETFPYTENFRYPSCWRTYATNEGDTNVWEYQLLGEATAHGDSADTWLVSPRIMLDVEYPELSWSGIMDFTGSYKVYYCFDDIEDQIDTNNMILLKEFECDFSEGNFRLLLPEELYGESCHIAFRFMGGEGYEGWSYYDESEISISNITIKRTEPYIKNIQGSRHFSSYADVIFTAEVESLLPVSYEWSFEGSASESVDSNVVVANWNEAAPGQYEVTLTITTDAGDTSRTIMITVLDCQTITEFPYAPEFSSEDGLGCWMAFDEDHDNSTWNVAVYTGNFESTASNGQDPDNWLISQAIELPEDASDFVLSFKAEAWQQNANHYAVYISTTGTAIEDFGEPILDEVCPYNRETKEFDMSEYGGQTIYIAFRHYNSVGGSRIQISDVKVGAVPPYVTLSASEYYATIGQTVNFTATAQGHVNSYSWTVDGASVDCTANTFSTSFSIAGYHVVKVIASNTAGSDFATLTVTVMEVGVEDNADASIVVYPNPVRDMLSIKANDVTAVQIIDINGRVVLQSQNMNIVDLSSLANGVYYVKVATLNNETTTKIVKQ